MSISEREKREHSESLLPQRRLDLAQAVVSEFQTEIGHLLQLSGGELLPATRDLAQRLFQFSQCSAFVDYKNNLTHHIHDGQGEESTKDEKLAKALSTHDLSLSDPNSSEWHTLLSLVSMESQIQRELLRRVFRSKESALNFDDVDRSVALGMLDLQDYADVWYGEYQDALSHESFTQEFERLQKEEGKNVDEAQQILKAQLEASGLAITDTKYLYTMLKRNETEDAKEKPWVGVSYRDAFPDTLGAIEQILAGISEDLATSLQNPSLKDKAQKVKAYIDAWYDSATVRSVDPAYQRQLGIKLDSAWMDLPDSLKVLPIHPMETYSDRAARFRIDPQVILALPDNRNPELTQRCTTVKDAMYEVLKDRYGERNAFVVAQPALDHTRVGLYVTLGSGVDLRQAVTGITLPNDEFVKINLAKGVRIVDIVEGQERLWNQNYRPLLDKVLTSNIDEDFPTAGMIELNAIFNTAAHEGGHVHFRDQTTETDIGKELEEHKADWIALWSGHKIINQLYPNVTESQQQDMLRKVTRMWFARFLRVLARINDPSARDYYLSGVAGLNAMLDIGLVKREGDKYVYNDAGEVGLELLDTFYTRVQEQLDRIVDIYDTRDRSLVARYKDDYLQESDALTQLMVTAGFIEETVGKDDPRLQRNISKK